MSYYAPALYAAPAYALAPELFFYQRPVRYVQRRDPFAGFADAFDQLARLDKAFEREAPSAALQRRDPFAGFADAFDQLARLDKAFEREAPSAALQRRDPFAGFADAFARLDKAFEPEDDSFLAEARGEQKLEPYSYSSYSSSVTVNGETRTTTRKQYSGSDGRTKTYQERALTSGDRTVKETKAKGFDEAEAALNFEGATAEEFASAWAPKAALEASKQPAAEEAVAPAPAAEEEAVAPPAEEEPVAPAAAGEAP